MSLLLTALLAIGPAGAEEAPPALLWVELPDAAARDRARALGLGFAEGQDGAWLRMQGPAGITAALDAAGLRWRPEAPLTLPEDEGYHSPEAMLLALELLAAHAPELVTLVDAGRSVEGRPLVALRLGTSAAPRLSWRLVGAHHGDEGSSAEVTLDAARRLVAAWGTDAALTELLARDEVWILPHANPDGIARGSRYNARTVDLNRNYGYRWSEDEVLSGDAPFSEPETRALRALGQAVPFAAGLSFHSGAANIGWVWNSTTTPTPDAALLSSLAQVYADDCGVAGFWTTNGADWYITYGDANDWSYGRHGVLDFTVEVSVARAPPARRLAALLDQHWPAIRAFLLAPDSVAGRVVDARTGQGIPALVSPVDGGWPMVAGPDGRFGRVTGTATPLPVEVSAAGYAPVQVELPAEGELAEVALEPLAGLSLRPEPAVALAEGELSLALPVDGAGLRLLRPGLDPVEASPDEEGAWRIPAGELAPGAWDLELDGLVSPRALLLTDPATSVSLDQVLVDDDGLARVTGQDLGRGSQAWVLAGEVRALVPVAVEARAEDELLVDLGPWLAESGPVDLVVLSRGHLLAVADVLDAEPAASDTGTDTSGTDTSGTDTGGDAPADPDPSADGADSGPPPTGASAPAGCGCAQPSSSSPPLLLLLLLAPLLAGRRRSAA